MKLPPHAHRSVAGRVLARRLPMPPHLILLSLVVTGFGCRGPAPARGERSARVTVEASTREALACPVVAGISAHPLEARVGGALALQGVATQSDAELAWTGRGGTFSSAVAKETEFTCAAEGDHPLTLTVRKVGCPDDAKKVVVTCTPPLTPASRGFAGSGP